MMTYFPQELARVILSEEQIQDRIKEMAAQIEADYKGVKRIYLVGILKGAFIFMADLARRLRINHVVDFIAVTSYGRKGTESGEVRLLMDLREPVAGEHILIIEDIIDSGKTVQYLNEILTGRQPASLKTCAFVQKKRDHIPVAVDYLGFTIPDVWVVGYGLDYAERYRTLPYVAELKKEAYS